MFRENLKIILLVCGIGFVSSLPCAPRYALKSITDDELLISVELPAELCGQDRPLFFAFSTLPGEPFTASVSNNEGHRRFACTQHSSGWAGRCYLQWCSFNPARIPCRGARTDAEINVRFDGPVFRGITRDKVTCKGSMIVVPLPAVLAKTAVALPDLPYSRGLKIEILEDGIYELSTRILRERGVPVDRISSRNYRLFERGREVPILITNSHHARLEEGDRILFYGRHLRSSSGRFEDFSLINVYWLTWEGGVGARVAVVSGARRTDPTVYTAAKSIIARDYLDTLHVETDRMINWLGNVEGRPPEELTDDPAENEDDFDNWYWGSIGIKELSSFTFNVPAPSTRGAARISVGLMGLSSIDSVENDHHLEVFINDYPASSRNVARWDGQRPFIFESDTFPVNILLHGENKITMHTVSDLSDRSVLNWIDIIYTRGYDVLEDRMEFRNSHITFGKTVEYSLHLFSGDDIELWDISRYRYFTGMITEDGSGNDRGTRTLIFQDSVASSTTYFAQALDRRIVPGVMYLDTIADIWDDVAGDIDYISISVDSFRTELEPLLREHEADGLKTAFVDIDDIYNRFSFGVRNPESIRDFLKYLFGKNAGRPPRYLLLGGDTTHDLDKRNRKRNIVPTHLSRIPGWGPGADDGYFATVQGDDLFPDLSVGRFPAQNREDMRLLVDKTIRYIREPSRGYWRDNLLLLGGGETIFSRFNDEAVRESIGSRMHIMRMDADPESRFYKDEFIAPQLIADHMNTGVMVVNFNGHGGGNVWSDNNFFSYNDFTRLHNGQWGGGGRLPAIFSFTCLTGFFESSEYRSLGEEFIRTDNNGAIAFYGASAYTSRTGNFIINKMVLDEVLNGGWKRIGDIIDYCELSMLVRYNIQYLPLIRQYNLLGDPALVWNLTPDTLRFSQTFDEETNTLKVKGTCPPVMEGEVRVSLTSDYQTWDRAVLPVKKGTFTRTFKLKDAVSSALATVRTYAWNDSSEVRGWMNFVKDTLLIHDTRLDPSRPCFDDSVTVSTRLATDDSPSDIQLLCLYALAVADEPQISFTGVPMESDTSGRWRTIEKILLPYTGAVNERLYLRFRMLSEVAALESPLTSYPVCGRPDLQFGERTLRMEWMDDSLKLLFDVLNTGNAAAPRFSVACMWNRAGSAADDTIACASTDDSLDPGARTGFSVAVADTQGALSFYAVCNAGGAFSEIIPENNRIDGRRYVFYADLMKRDDTLHADDDSASLDKGTLRVFPATSFKKRHRVFVFEDTIGASQPLPTPSRWSVTRAAVPVKWILRSRPSLDGKDSLRWIWDSGESVSKVATGDTVSAVSAFMVYDSVIGRWRYRTGEELTGTTESRSVVMKTAETGPFTFARLEDVTKPEIIVSVYGKTINSLDYSAKGRPFTVFLSDASGVLPRSVGFHLNGKLIEKGLHSSLPEEGDLRSLTMSVYPDAEKKVDSLTVSCADLAGNSVERTFPYLPGRDLSIRSFSCHPNPFTARRKGDGSISKIRFAFLLTDVASSVTLSIYTVSGKKIRTWSRSELIGYQQIEWDGRDRDGYRLANGTYYAKLVVKNDRKKDKMTIRIAKLEGF